MPTSATWSKKSAEQLNGLPKNPEATTLSHECKAPGVGASAPTLSSNKAPEEMVFVPTLNEITSSHLYVRKCLCCRSGLRRDQLAQKEFFVMQCAVQAALMGVF